MRRWVLAFLVVAISALTVSAVQASTHHFKSKVAIKGTGDCKKRGCLAFNGTVRSPHDACERKRTVKVFLKEDPETWHWKGETDPAGDWSITITYVVDSDYFAKVKKRVLGSGNVCKGDRSDLFNPES
jgi:hypothetical protein